MDRNYAVAAYVQGRLEPGAFIAELVGAGESEALATAYARVLNAQPRSGNTAVGNIYPPPHPGELIRLSAEETAALAAIAARIMPSGASPGAPEAGAVNYIADALNDAYAHLLAAYHRGLHAIDSYCVSELGAPFAKLGQAEQDAVLTDLAAGKLADAGVDADFFNLLRGHVLEGMFCEPSYGGNRDLIGWRLVGFPGQRYGYPDAYVNRVIDLEPIAQDGPPRREV
jgi:gluconate 2-dehydrogenase gamma chain